MLVVKQIEEVRKITFHVFAPAKYTVSMPEKILICLNRGCEESVGNEDVSFVCTRKYEGLG